MRAFSFKCWLLTAIVLLEFSGLSLDLACAVEPVAPAATVDDNTRAIAASELELMELSTRLRLQSISGARWRARRWFAYSFSNQTLTVVGALLGGCGRFRYLHNPRLAPRDFFEHAAWLRIMANCISIGGSAIEGSLDFMTGLRERRQGIDLPTVVKRAKVLLLEIDKLLTQRTQLLTIVPEGSKSNSLQTKTAILQNMRDILAADFAESYGRLRGVRAARYLQYLWVTGSNAAGGSGTLSGVVASSRKYGPKRSGAGGVGDIISGSMNMIAPSIIAATDLAARRIVMPANVLTKSEQSRKLQDLSAKLSELESRQTADTQGNNSAGLNVSSRIFELEKEVLAQHLQARDADDRGLRRRLLSQEFGAGVGGACKLVNGIEVARGCYRWVRQPHERFEAFGRGGITYGLGMLVTAEESLRRQTLSEIKTKRQPPQKAVDALLKNQLEQLQAARQALLKATAF